MLEERHAPAGFLLGDLTGCALSLVVFGHGSRSRMRNQVGFRAAFWVAVRAGTRCSLRENSLDRPARRVPRRARRSERDTARWGWRLRGRGGRGGGSGDWAG